MRRKKTGGRTKGTPNRKTAAVARALRRSEDLSADRVLEELRRLSFSNVQDLFDEAGNLRPIQELTRDQASCIASLEIIKKNAEAGDGHIDVVHKLKVWDKTRSLEMLAKHYALLVEKIEHMGEIRISWLD
jgi:phage terminase small subunit